MVSKMDWAKNGLTVLAAAQVVTVSTVPTRFGCEAGAGKFHKIDTVRNLRTVIWVSGDADAFLTAILMAA